VERPLTRTSIQGATEMDNDLTYLIDNAIGCRNSLALAGDKFVGWLESIRDAAAKCEADLKLKQAMADAEIDRRRAEIEELKDARFKLERELAQLRKKLEAEQKLVGRELEHLRSLLAAA
jgi:hypothetical protein